MLILPQILKQALPPGLEQFSQHPAHRRRPLTQLHLLAAQHERQRLGSRSRLAAYRSITTCARPPDRRSSAFCARGAGGLGQCPAACPFSVRQAAWPQATHALSVAAASCTHGKS